jgi:hypothetical protein
MVADVGAQLRKGVGEYCVLGLLSRETMYGWQLSERLVSAGLIASIGSLYTMLSCLRGQGLVTVLDEPSASGPVRRASARVDPYGDRGVLVYRDFMATDRVLAPEQPHDGSKLKGPASYFPSIESTYGKPIQEWLDLVSERLAEDSHMQVVTHLKTEHAMGHGHANAIVAYVRAAQK